MPSVYLLMPGVALESTGAVKEGIVETSLKDKQLVPSRFNPTSLYRDTFLTNLMVIA